MWLALLILVTGWWITIDGAISIAFRLGELDESDITTRQEIEFAARLVRGILGLILVVVAFFLVI